MQVSFDVFVLAIADTISKIDEMQKKIPIFHDKN